MLRNRKLGKVFFEMDDNPLMEVQYHAKLVVVPVSRRVVDDRTHDLDVDVLAAYHMVSVSASSSEVMYIVDASQEVVDLLQDLSRCWSCRLSLDQGLRSISLKYLAAIPASGWLFSWIFIATVPGPVSPVAAQKAAC
jgi:hypothetical protein